MTAARKQLTGLVPPGLMALLGPDAGAVESIGGYRIIRRLGSGSRADVLLGHAGLGPGGEPQLAAIKVFRAGVPDESIDAEITALSRLSHPHIVELVDLATGPRNAPSLILQRLEPSGLGRLLAERKELSAGEAVTILAPVAAAVAAMHRTGVTHGRLGSSAVLFDTAGTPTLSGFGGAGVVAATENGPVTPALLDSDPAVAADLDALTVLVSSVLARVLPPSDRAADYARWVGEQRNVADFAALVERSLFAFAEPTPVTFIGEVPRPAVPHRLDPVGTGETPEPRPPASPRVGGALLARASGYLPDRLRPLLAAAVSGLSRVRRRVWAIAAVGATAVVVAFAIVQLPPSDVHQESAPPEEAPVLDKPPAPDVIGGADPIAAAVALLDRRERCLAELSVLCLDGVHQPDSAAWQVDAARIHGVRDGEELDDASFPADTLTIIDRMGDTVLLATGDPGASPPGNATASVLIIRTEAGWRIRSLLSGSALLAPEEAQREG